MGCSDVKVTVTFLGFAEYHCRYQTVSVNNLARVVGLYKI